MPGRLIIDGNAVYEIDEDCMKCQRGRRISSQNLPDNDQVRFQSPGKKGRKQGCGQ